MAAPTSLDTPDAASVQRSCCSNCDSSSPREEADETVSRLATDERAPTGLPSIVDEVGRTSGILLDVDFRSGMESAFGHDFSSVRIHTDARAAEAARTINARAYTSGDHIVFAEGQFDPSSTLGRHLLMHEFAHVVQQRSGVIEPGISRPGDPSELEADRLADTATGHSQNFPRRVDAGRPVRTDARSPANGIVQRWPGDGLLPPGDCTWAKYLPLAAAVDAAKLVTDALGGCNATDRDCILLAAKIAAAAAEIAARVALDTSCFRGGNTGHRQQVQDKVEMLNKCHRFFSSKGCPAELAALAAAAAAAAALAAEAATIAKAALALLEALVAAGEALAAELTLVEVLEGLLVLLAL